MELSEVLASIRAIHRSIRDEVVSVCERQEVEALSAVDFDGAGDTIYAVDRVSEDVLVERIEAEIASRVPVVLIAEGLEGGSLVLPRDAAPEDAVYRVLVDPIDGTRGLMYQKRSAWVLTGVAPNRGDATHLGDIELAVMTEIPLVKQHLSDVLWATRGQGVHAERFDRVHGTSAPLELRASQAKTLEHGFSQVVRFFPGARTELAEIEDEICAALMGPPTSGKAQCFEDQYISTGGQLYELIVGHDRFTADLRPLAETILARRGEALGICCHPYDLCTELVAREAGVQVCKPSGAPLDAPLAVEGDVAWVAYANAALRELVEAQLHAALTRRGLDLE